MLSTNFSNHLDYNSPNNTFTTSSNSSSGSSPSSSTSTSYNPSSNSNSGAIGENSAVSYSALNSNKSLKRSKKQKKQTPPEKRRVRTGCLTCRSKHKKCDETKPICEFCKAKNLQCIWPKEGMTRPSQLNDTLKQLISLQKQQPQSQSQSQQQSQFQAPSQPNLQARAPSLSLPSLDYIQDSSLDQLLFPQLQVSSAPSTCNRKVNYLKLPTNFPSLLSIIPAIQAGTLSLTSHSFIFFNDKHPSVKNSIFSNSLTSLLSNFFITDPTYLLHLKNPHHILSLSRDYKPLTYSILAISSRILEQFDDSYSGENTIDFYTLSVRELSKSLREGIHGILKESIRGKECIWWTVVLLGWFEILSLKPTDSWERLHGILEFFETLGILGIDDNMEPLIGLLIISFGSYSLKKKNIYIKNGDNNGNDETESGNANGDNEIRNEINNDNKINNNNNNNNDNDNNNANDNDNDNDAYAENFNDLNLIQNFKHLTNKNNNEVLNILCKILLNKSADDINEWVEIWNMLLDWKLRSSTDYDSYSQDDGKIIFSIDKILFNNLLYHVSCYYMLKNKPTNISLVYQNLSDPTSVVAFAMCQDMNELDELINWHKDKLVKIIESNMTNKTEKSAYCLLACWFCCLTLINDKNFDKVTVGNVLKKMENWSGMCFVGWLVDKYMH